MQIPIHNFDKIPGLHPLKSDEEPDLDVPLPAHYLNSVKKYAELPIMGYRAGLSTNQKKIEDVYTTIKFCDSAVYVSNIVKIMKQNDLKAGDRIVIYAKNSPLWILTDLAAQFLDIVICPVYDTLGLDNIIYCCNLVGAKAIAVCDDYLANAIGIADKIQTLKVIISFDDYSPQQLLNQTKKVYATQQEGVAIPDDTRSMYSMGSNVLSNTKTQEQNDTQDITIDCQEIELLITQKSNKQCSLVVLNEFEQISKETIQKSTEFLQNCSKQSKTIAKDLFTILFTSGTTGRPKGVALSHKNINAGMTLSGHRQKPYHLARNGQPASTISYLPLAHVFERALEYGCILRGQVIYYSSGNIKLLSKELSMTKPTMMIGVPRVYCKIHQAVMNKLRNSSVAIRTVFKVAYNIKKFYFFIHPNGYKTGRLFMVDKVFKQIMAGFGGQMEFVVSGSASMPSDVREFLQICSGAQLNIGYGLTETSATGMYNHAGQKYFEPAELGHASYMTETKLVDASDRCEYSLEKHKIGEICVKGPGVGVGYIDGKWGNIKPLVDKEGYYHTGDLGKYLPDRSASFVRRISFVVKMQQGEFIDLELVEQVLETSPLIVTAFVHAESHRSAPICFLSLDSNVLKTKVSEKLIEKFKEGEEVEIEQIMYEYCDNYMRQKGLKAFNIPKAYKIHIDADWTQNSSLYTPTQKKRRTNFTKHYENEVAQLWKHVEKREQKGEVLNQQLKKQKLNAWQISFVVAIILLLIAFFNKK